jgi:hypothetical protein
MATWAEMAGAVPELADRSTVLGVRGTPGEWLPRYTTWRAAE